MAVELIDFYRPDEREKNLYLTGIPTSLPRPEIWGKLYDAFSPYGLLYGIHLVEQSADSNPLGYGFVTYYSGAAARRAQRELNGHLNIGGTRIRVQFSDRIKPAASPLLHSSRCQELANYYLGFHGWSSHVTAMEAVPNSVVRATGQALEKCLMPHQEASYRKPKLLAWQRNRPLVGRLLLPSLESSSAFYRAEKLELMWSHHVTHCVTCHVIHYPCVTCHMTHHVTHHVTHQVTSLKAST
ncbi:hypothetical protein EMCRGX_G014246 [Ephydatia muelleri]